MRRIKELYGNLTRRVLLIPAITGMLIVFLHSYSDKYLMSAFASAVVLFLMIVSGKYGRQLMTLLITALVCLYLCGYFIVYNAQISDIPYGNTSFECKVHSVNHTLDGTYKIRAYSGTYGFIEFKLNSGYIPVTGEEIVVEGMLFEPDTPRNPGQFDYRSYLKRRGIKVAVSPETIESIRSAPVIFRYLSSAQEQLFALRERILSLYGENAPLAASVFLGDSSLTEDSVRSVYQRNGCAHLLAVSGTHFAGFLSLLTYFLNKQKKTRISACIFIFFCVVLASFTGWSSSVTRSCVMCSASYCSKDTLSGLSIACLLMTLADPYNALSYGFLMTCSASVGILYITPIFKKRADKVIGKSLSAAISPVIASHIGMLPFIAITSQKYGVIPLAVQIVTSFVASAACAFFVPSVILSFLLSAVFIAPSSLMLTVLNMIVKTVDRYYFGASVSTSLSVAVLFLFVVFLLKSSVAGRILKVPAVSLLCLGILSSMFGLIFAPEAKVVFIDVGQGDSCLILCGGKTVLIDGGTYEAGEDAVLPVLEYFDIRHVDVAVATHWDRDHLGGLLYLYQQGRVDRIYTSYVEEGPKQKEIMNDYLDGEIIQDIFVKLSAGDFIKMSDECELNVIHPESGDVSDGGNDDSLVIELLCKDTSILLTGDLGIERENELLDSVSIGEIDILKAGHHGSAFSTGYSLLEDTTPDIAVISAGVNNQYGHPAPETLKRLNEYDVQVISTQDSGAITVDIYPDRFVISEYLKSH